MSDAKPVWLMDPFIAQMADKFIGGTELEAGHIANSIAYLSFLLAKLAKPPDADATPSDVSPPESHPLLPSFEPTHMQALLDAQKLLGEAQELATAQPQEAEDLTKLVREWIATVQALPIGHTRLVPGGWVGLRASNVVTHLVTRTGAETFAFVSCNVASGLAYHPSRPGPPPKLLRKTAIRLEGIPTARMTDPAFWGLLFTQWMRQTPSEYHRSEVLYDILLPWLAGRLLPLALAETQTDPRADWRTPARSGTGFFGAVREALRYYLRDSGLTSQHLKQLTAALRWLALDKARCDLRVLADPEGTLRDGLALGLGPAPAPEGVGELPPQAMEALLATRLRCRDGSEAPASRLLLRQQQQAGQQGQAAAAAASSAASSTTFALYFGGGWCEACTAFLPLLAAAHATVRSRQQPWTVVYVPMDKTAEEFETSFAGMPEEWTAVPFADEDTRRRLTEVFKVKAVPTVVVFGQSGRVYTVQGVRAIRADPDCLSFPWSPAAMAAAAAARGPAPLAEHEALLLQWACQNYVGAAIKEHTRGCLAVGSLRAVQGHVERITAMANELPGGARVAANLGLGAGGAEGGGGGIVAMDEAADMPDASAAPKSETAAIHMALQAALRPEARVARRALPGGDLLLVEADEGRYAGVQASPTPPQPVNALELLERVASVGEALQALETTQRVCYLLLDRARESSTASRLVLQYEVLTIVGHLFTRVLPQPAAPGTESGGEDIWATALSRELQLKALEHIYHLTLTYGQMWQAVEQAPRDCDCERAVVVACMLAIFDAILRRPALDAPLVLSVMLNEGGGHRLSTTVCQGSMPFAELAARLELRDPHMLRARAGALAYFAGQEHATTSVLFQLRQPDKIEVKKYGATLLFLRSLLERLGYELMPRDMRMPKPEIEMLVEWMVGDATTLATEHPEWAMVRDMVVMFKFLATMESKEAELMRSRKEKQTFSWWSLSFDEGGRRGWWGALRGKPLSWEAVNFRGMDMDTADLQITGFGERKLVFGEGPATKSPAAPARYLGIEYPSEDDVLHCDSLPTFNNTLSREEAEQLMSYLTVDYVRVPLVLGFFASRDRVTYLFNPGLQALLRAVLFEGGEWTPAESQRPIPQVPIRMTHEQQRQHKIKLLREGKPQPETEVLGTPLGLLYNELVHSPVSCADAVMAMLRATRPLHVASVYSADASFLLYMLMLALDTEGYVRAALRDNVLTAAAIAALRTFATDLGTFIRHEMGPALARWLAEAEKRSDTVTACVSRAYMALLYSNVPPAELGREEAVGFLASFLFVRNWHNFGLDHATIATSGTHEAGLSAEDRLLRFLQAHGVDTARLKAKDLQKYLKGKPLFLSVGGVTVRAPILADQSGDAKHLPPTHVPEYRLMIVHHELRRTLCQFLERAEAAHELDNILQDVMRVALRSPQFEDAGWRSDGPGRFASAHTELKLDLQTGEVLWRNDDLKPVPDSISQFSDYQAMFRGAALHCGIVAKQQRRQWVHIVGTKYDLLEWDEPDVVDQGVGCPKAPPAVEEGAAVVGQNEPRERVEAAEQLHAALGFELARCLRALRVTGDNMEEAANRLLAGGTLEEVEDVEAPAAFLGNLSQRYRRVEAPKAVEFADRASYGGTIYSRHFDHYDERPHCGLEPAEHWIADLLQPVLMAVYPPFPPDKKITYKLLLPETTYSPHTREARLLGCSNFDKENATWKEVVVERHRGLVRAYNLVSHGRRMYRTLIYCSDHRFSIHSLKPNTDPQATPRPPALLKEAGVFRSQRAHEPSLLIVRRNTNIGGHETLLPKRLLAGLLPAALLEAHQFWRGEDGLLRGDPQEADSQWFNYRLLVRLQPGDQENAPAQARVLRLPSSVTVPVVNAREAVTEANMLVRQSSASRPAAAVVNYDESSVEELVALGFSAAAARRALRESHHNKARAADWLFDPTNMVAVSEAAREEATQAVPAGGADATVDESLLQSLADMGFSRPASRRALAVYGDVEQALSWLADEGNAPEIERLELEAATARPDSLASKDNTGHDDAISGAAAAPAPLPADEPSSPEAGAWELLDLAGAPKGTALFRLASVLTRIEDLSHILAWGLPVGGDESSAQVEVIELPRLKVRFNLQLCEGGRLRLALVDQAGWFVSDVLSEDDTPGVSTQPRLPAPCRQQLAQLLDGLEHALLLDDDTGGFMALVPNHDIHRPPVAGAPFSGALVFDRGAMGWMATMDTRYYLYPVHSSFNHLNSASLASTLYLSLLRLMARQYARAFAWVEAASTDTDLLPEETWIYEQLERSVGDRHPEAIAVRLKLSLALMYSNTTTKWELHEELTEYLSKLPGVGAAVRLTPEEELNVLTLCKQMTPLLKNRLAFLQAALGRQTGLRRDALLSTGANDAPALVEQKPARMRWGGQPWAKVQTISLDYLARSAAPLTRLHFKPPGETPGKLEDAEVLGILWDDALVADEESGSNRQLGFLFLYGVIQQLLTCTFDGRVINDSFGELTARLFQLKLARWGKEAAGEGEMEYVTSKQMVLLANMLNAAGASASWPVPPMDDASRRLLEQGVNLYTPPGRDSAVKEWVDMVDMVFRSVMTDPAHNLTVSAQIEAFAAVRDRPLGQSAHVPGTLTPEDLARLPPRLSNTACSVRRLTMADFGPEDAAGATTSGPATYAARPLACLGLDELVVYEETPAAAHAASTLPFDLSSHPSAQSAVSAELLDRLGEDVAGFAATHNHSRTPHLRGLRAADLGGGHGAPASRKALAAAAKNVAELRTRLADLQATDQSAVAAGLATLLDAVNRLEQVPSTDGEARTLFCLQRLGAQRAHISTDVLLAAVTSAVAEADLARANPFVAKPLEYLQQTAALLLRCSRSAQLRRARGAARGVAALLEQLLAAQDLATPGTTALLQRLAQEQGALAAILASQRHYAQSEGEGASATLALDPRFLLSEFLFDILLRRRQVEIVTQMASAAAAGQSKVQQMIMGAGKTTVVGPLLSLLLADGDQLVVQVMPTALLAQTRDVLRGRFAAVLRKRIFTLQFDRSIEDVEEVARLYDKLNGARLRGDVVCAPPEAVKSLMLKFVEELERLESFDMDSLTPNESLRNSREVSRLRDQLTNRSAVADGVCSLLDMLNRDGVLIMDEVDVILNPLKSELNFPIGASAAMAGYRWDLPVHLVDALFWAQQGRMLAEPEPPAADGLDKPGAILAGLHAALEEGMASAAMQREPHVVLLSRTFYWDRLRPWVARWCLLWLLQVWDAVPAAVTLAHLLDYLMEGTAAAESTLAPIREHLSPESTRMLNLASDWTRTLMPHCLSKINRVAYGLLTPSDLARLDPRAPQSRRLMAVPFVGKDVPSRSSEFAHPDVLIGLTVLAYRYEGLRRDDLRRVVVQLKQDLSRQVGPRERRPASELFQGWLEAAAAMAAATTETPRQGVVSAADQLQPLPLPLFQPGDPAQLAALHVLLQRLPHTVYYYLRQHVFPSTMRSQALKVSASGVDLGSSILFGRARLGFSGTPNNLMPADLGRCEYEPGSDGRVVHVLTSPSVTTASIKRGWTARSLLDDVACAAPAVQALIDTGALITGLDNAEAAAYLLERLPEAMEGVVYLDRHDQQMILLRASGRAMPLAQCGVSPARRFTFYDQVHTTGMDIKQAPNARAVLTIGKDMTFRDYAQGAFRMRQIGQGQTIHLYIISEVDELLRQELHATTGRPEIDIPAWLLVNSMNVTSMQFCKLGLQELHNVWRKRAMSALQNEVHVSRGTGVGSAADAGSGSRMRRFMGDGDAVAWLKACVSQFREAIGYPLPDKVPTPEAFSTKLRGLKTQNAAFSTTDAERAAIDHIIGRVEQVSEQHVSRIEGGLDSECVHENEAQAEEEAEEEAEQEEEKMSAFTRDDEQHNPWAAALLTQVPTLQLGGDEPFYALRDFRVRPGQPCLQFPSHLLLTDNFFRTRWVGMGERRLKNIALILEWAPLAAREALQAAVGGEFQRLVAGGMPPNQAAAAAMKASMAALDAAPAPLGEGRPAPAPGASPRFQVAVSLAEGETLRRIIHSRQGLLRSAGLALRSVEGALLDQSHLMATLSQEGAPIHGKPAAASSALDASQRQAGLLCLRFVNNEMFFAPEEVDVLLAALEGVPVADRVAFFTETLRLRRRERNRWADTPLNKVLTERDAWHLLGARAKLEQFNAALIARRAVDLLATFRRFDEDNDGRLNYAELQRCFESLQLGFAPRDLAEIIPLADPTHTGYVSEEQLRATFAVRETPDAADAMDEQADVGDEPAIWQCRNCTFINPLSERTCAVCELGWTGERECPPGKWTCEGCTFFNPNALFYCDVCGRVRSDLSSVRF